MNKEQKAAVIEEVANQISASEAVIAVDYRGISVPQAAQLRERLGEAGATFRVVKNTLTQRAADKAGTESLKELLEGPTAFTFVAADGDPAVAAKALATFRREHDVLGFKGGLINGEALSIDQIEAISRLAPREQLNAQLAGLVASPITGLVRGLGSLIQGLAIQLKQVEEKGLVGGEAPAAEAPLATEAPAESAEEEAPAEQAEEAPAEQAEESPAEPAEELPAEPTEHAPAAEATEESKDESEAPAEGEEEKE